MSSTFAVNLGEDFADPREDADPTQIPPPMRTRLQAELRAVEARMLGCIGGGDALVPAVCAHLVKAGGKRLRPTLLLIAARVGPRTSPHQISAAAGVELLHLATLYHDDIVDQAESRRGVPSANARWGNGVAAFAGGYLLARATELFALAGDETNRLASEAAAKLWKGQMEEAEGVYDLDLDEQRFLGVVERKTGALYELPCSLGARLSGADAAIVAALERYGRCLGIAFQIVDDTLDIVADASVLGKEPGSDIREGIYTLPVIYTLAADAPGAERLRALLSAPDLHDGEVAEARRILQSNGSVRRALDAAWSFVAQAKAAVAALPDASVRAALSAIATGVVHRRGLDRGVGHGAP